jgi:hypothetical protein
MRVWRDTRQSGKYLLYGANTTLGWRVVRTISFEEGERREAAGSLRRVNDSISGNHIGYQIVPTSERRGDRDLPSLSSTASISQREMEINAGEGGHSRTAGMTEERRLEQRVPEDRIERVQAKVAVYAYVTGKSGSILEVWPK